MSDSGAIFEARTEGNSEFEPSSGAALIAAHGKRPSTEPATSEAAASCSPHFVRRILRARVARRDFFGGELFADPAWDILLELYALRCEQRRTSVSKLCIAAAVPTTTALRWIDKLLSDGLLEREPDRNDGRRVWVAISDQGFEKLNAYLQGHGAIVPL